jgi:hypothetical protein
MPLGNRPTGRLPRMWQVMTHPHYSPTMCPLPRAHGAASGTLGKWKFLTVGPAVSSKLGFPAREARLRGTDRGPPPVGLPVSNATIACLGFN